MKLRWSPKTKVAVVMVVALCLPVSALITAQLLRLYYLEETKPVQAILNQQLLQGMRKVEKQILVERNGLAAELAGALEPADLSKPQELHRRLQQAAATKPFIDLAVFYSPETGAFIAPRPAPADSFEASERMENGEQLAGSIEATYQRFTDMLVEGEKSRMYSAVEDFLVVLKRNRNQYNTAHYVLLHDAEHRPAGVLGFTMDRKYLQETLFNEAFRKVQAAEPENSPFDYTVLGIRDRETGDLIWTSEPTSAKWDAKDARKSFDYVMLFHVMVAKMKGMTIDEMAHEFMMRNLLLVLGLAVVMFGGLFFTWRSVNREMELARLKSDFVSNVSHELKTPLSLIRLFAETLELGRVRTSEKAQEYYSIIRKESERLTGLINNLLDFSRIEAGGKQYRFEPTNLAGLVEQTLESYRYHLEQRGFELEEHLDAGLPAVQVDREAYSLCLLNLLDNAVKYSGDSRKVAVSLFRENGSAALGVEDHGIGIHRKDHRRIFEKFFRAGDPLVHNTKGSGLGLSLVKHVAQAHHGSVAVESSPGQGSKFTLRVPIDDAGRN